MEPASEGCPRLIKGPITRKCSARYRLDHGQQVFAAVRKLPHQQPLPLLRALLLRDVDIHTPVADGLSV
jgi:hypothetical protein